MRHCHRWVPVESLWLQGGVRRVTHPTPCSMLHHAMMMLRRVCVCCANVFWGDWEDGKRRMLWGVRHGTARHGWPAVTPVPVPLPPKHVHQAALPADRHLFVLGDTSFAGCCVDEVAAEVCVRVHVLGCASTNLHAVCVHAFVVLVPTGLLTIVALLHPNPCAPTPTPDSMSCVTSLYISGPLVAGGLCAVD
jgi:hypothetical protein